MTGDREKFLVLLTALAEFKNVKMPAPIVGVYDKAAQEIGYQNAVRSMQEFVRESKLPSPEEMRKRGASETADTDGDYVAGRILEAASKIGRYDINRVHAFIGELGVEVVKLFGGWNAVCDLPASDLGMSRAQLRQITKAVIDRSKAGTLNEAPKLPENSRNSENQLLSQNETPSISNGNRSNLSVPVLKGM